MEKTDFGTLNLDGYQLDSLILKGEYTLIYRAIQSKLDRPVVLKVLKPEYYDDLEVLNNFRDEINIGTILNHPHIAKIHNAGEQGRYMYYTMDLLHEGVLVEKAERGLFSSVERCLKYFRGMAEGLKYTLEQGFYHGELSADKIFVNREGVAKLFGFRYAAEDVDLLDTDIQAFGRIFFEILSGIQWEKNTAIEPLHKIRQDVTPYLSGLVTDLVTNGAKGRIKSYDKLLKAIIRAQNGRSGSAIFNKKLRKRIRK